MTGTILQNPHAEAILAALGTVTVASQPLKVGDAIAPKSASGSIVAPCAVLYLLPGGIVTGALCERVVDGELRFQVTCVGRMAVEARTVADKVTEKLSAGLTVTGRSIPWVRQEYVGSNVDRDTDVSPPLFYVPVQFRLWSISAPAES